jgi:transketolase
MNVEPIEAKLEAFGWSTLRVDANDVPALRAALATTRAVSNRPYALVCDTVPGKGAATIEGFQRTHYVRAGDEVWANALADVQ